MTLGFLSPLPLVLVVSGPSVLLIAVDEVGARSGRGGYREVVMWRKPQEFRRLRVF